MDSITGRLRNARTSAGADRVGDVHEDAVTPRDLDVVLPRRHTADRDRDDHEVRARERLALVERALDSEVGPLARDKRARERTMTPAARR